MSPFQSYFLFKLNKLPDFKICSKVSERLLKFTKLLQQSLISSNKTIVLNFSVVHLVWSSSLAYEGPELIVNFLFNSSYLTCRCCFWSESCNLNAYVTKFSFEREIFDL